jgi:hypothetical protein
VRARSSAAALQQLRGREAGEAALWRESRRSGAMARKQAKPGCFLTEQLLHGSALRHCCPFGPVASVASISTLSKKKKKKNKKKTKKLFLSLNTCPQYFHSPFSPFIVPFVSPQASAD